MGVERYNDFQLMLAVSANVLGWGTSVIASLVNNHQMLFDIQILARVHAKLISCDPNASLLFHFMRDYTLPLLLLSQRDFDEAAPLYRRGLTIQEKALGPDHPNLAKILNNFGVFLGIQVELSYTHIAGPISFNA